MGKNTSAVVDKQRKRRDSQAGSDGAAVSVETLTAKFKPLWVRAVSAAIADVKGHIANQIKNDAFEKAKRKLSQVESLQNALEALESGNTDTPSSVKSETGTITRGYSSSYNAQHSEGPQKLLKDISAGDQKKLGTVLGFFKRALITG